MFAIAECSASGEIEVGRMLPVFFSTEEKARLFLDAFVKQRLCQDGPSALTGAGAYAVIPLSTVAPAKCPYHPVSGCPVRSPVP
jgi:hypothetical protein